MTPLKEFEEGLITEYNRAKETLLSEFSSPLEKKAAKESIDATLLMCTASQVELIIEDLPSEYLAGIYIESDLLSRKVPAYVGFDFSGGPSKGLNKITKDAIGHIGNFNEEVANELKLRYGDLIKNNDLINSIDAHGWTASVEQKMVKMGFDKETINLIKHQTTTNKMIQILEQRGLRGGVHPTKVAKLLQPHIRGIFGDEGVTINNIGRTRRVFTIDADGNYKWINKKTTHLYHTTTKNYADIIARSTMLDANRLGRFETLERSGFVQQYRSVAVMDGSTGVYDAMMHGQIVLPGEGPQYHPRCRCELSPIWNKKTGLRNKTDLQYTDERDAWFWKQYQFKEYNKTLPKGKKIPNYNFLPKNMLKGMPDKDGMRAIRAAMLKQPLKETDKDIANLLWAKTSKDGLEHGLIINKERISVVGANNKIELGARSVGLQNVTTYHTHPSWDAPTGQGDIGSFLYHGNRDVSVAISNNHIYKLSRTDKTPVLGHNATKEAQESMRGWVNKEVGIIHELHPSRNMTAIHREALINLNRRMAKKYNFNFEVTSR